MLMQAGGLSDWITSALVLVLMAAIIVLYRRCLRYGEELDRQRASHRDLVADLKRSNGDTIRRMNAAKAKAADWKAKYERAYQYQTADTREGDLHVTVAQGKDRKWRWTARQKLVQVMDDGKELVDLALMASSGGRPFAKDADAVESARRVLGKRWRLVFEKPE